MNTSVVNLYNKEYYNSSLSAGTSPNFRFNHVSDNNLEAIQLIKSFATLKLNWDSYGAEKPNQIAITKAVSFIVWISEFNQDVFFAAPSPDGNIVVELKQHYANLEFEFCSNAEDSVCAFHSQEFMNEAELNDTTKVSYLKWLVCPDGKCPPKLV